MKILLLWLQLGSHQKPGVHHGLASIAGYLKPKGHEVECQSISNESDLERVIESLKGNMPDCIGVSLTSNQRRYLDSCAKSIRKHFKGLIIAGGVHATLAPEDVLECSFIDGVCVGDGEKPLGLLADHLLNKTPYWDTPSFLWKNRSGGEEEIKKNQLYPLITDLAELPDPDYSIFNIEKINSQLGGFASIILTRGCPYDCTYCCNKAIKSVVSSNGNYFRILPVDHALRLLENYRSRYPETKGFVFEDDLLLVKKEWFKEFAQGYQKRIGLPYICNGRFELIQDEETVTLLKDSGCNMVNLGLESGDEEFRKKILKRRYSNQAVRNTARLLTQFDLPFFTYNIFGFPFETKKQMQNTIELNKEIRPNSGQAFFFYPYPGTELYDLCIKNKLLLPERMAEVSGYKEKPVIRMVNCTEKDCVKAFQQLTLYFISRRLSILLGHYSGLAGRLMNIVFMLYPPFFVKIFTKRNPVKQLLRRIFYQKLWKKASVN